MPAVHPGDLWSFAGVNLQQDTMRVRALDGFTAVPPQRGTGFVRSSIPGEMFRGKIHGARVIGLEILLFSRSQQSNGSPDLLPIFNNLDILAKAFNTQYQTEQPLVHNHPDGSVRTALAHCTGWNPKMSDDNVGAFWSGTAEFLMSDPYFYTPVVTSTITHTGGGSPTIVHPGTVRTHRIVISVTGFSGSFTGWSAANYTNNLLIQVDNGGVPLVSSDVLVIDCQAFTSTKNGTSNIGSLTHSGDLPFMVFEPGGNRFDIQEGTATVTWYPAYI